jgi:hypothetical protein
MTLVGVHEIFVTGPVREMTPARIDKRLTFAVHAALPPHWEPATYSLVILHRFPPT